MRWLKCILLLVFAGFLSAQFPGTLPTRETLIQANRNFSTQLNGGINNSTLTVVVDDASAITIGTPGSIVIAVDSSPNTEYMKVCSKSSNTLTICPGGRGFAGTSAASHSDNAAVIGGMLTAESHNEIVDAIAEIAAALGVNLENVASAGDGVLSITGTSGTDDYTGTATPALTSCSAAVILFLPDVANTGAATLDIDACGPLPIYQNDDATTLDDNDLLASVPMLLRYCAACNSPDGAWIVSGIIGLAYNADMTAILAAKQDLLSSIGNVELSNFLSGTATFTFATTGTAAVLTGSNNLLSLNVPFTAPSFSSTDTSNPGVLRFCEPGATPECLTFEAPASLTNNLGFQFGDTQPPAAGSVIELGAVAANKTAVTYRQLFSSGIILPALLPAATTTAQGAAELATTAETTTGTDAGRVVTPDGLSGSIYGRKTLLVEVFGIGTACSTGDKKRLFPIPADVNGMNLVALTGHVDTVGTTGTLNFDIARCAVVATGSTCSGTVVDVLSTNGTIDSNESKTSTAAAAAVIDTANDDVATDQVYRIDVDACHTTPSTGFWLGLTFQTP